MTDNQENVAHFIRLIRGISPQWLRYACTHGGCHRFFLNLKDRFPNAVPYGVFTKSDGHVVARIYGKYWDIWGVHDPATDGVPVRMGKDLLEKMSSCSFDEGFCMVNTHVVRNDDKRRKKVSHDD